MRRIALTLALVAPLAFLAGCLEITQEYTVNPDGSGKVVLEQVSPPPNQGATATPEQKAQAALHEHLKKAKGVDAWADLSAEPTKDNRVRVRATAYFADINKLDLENKGKQEIRWAKAADGGATLTFAEMNADDGGAADLPKTDAEIAARVKQEREQYEQSKQFMNAVFGTMKMQITFNLPGPVTAANLLTKDGNKASLSITGPQLIAAMDKIQADDALMRKKVAGGKKAENEIITELLFGGKGEPSAAVGAAQKPAFDYAAEVAKAKAAQAEQFKKVGYEAGK